MAVRAACAWLSGWLALVIPGKWQRPMEGREEILLPRVDLLDLDSRNYSPALGHDFLSVAVGEDLVGWRKLGLRFLPLSEGRDPEKVLEGVARGPHDRQESFTLKTGLGETLVMHCLLPGQSSESNGQDQQGGEPWSPSADEQEHMIHDAMRALKVSLSPASLASASIGASPGCLLYRKGWWTYELCPQKRIRQFHRVTAADRASAAARGRRPALEVGAVTSEFLLGRFLPKAPGATAIRFGNVFVMNYRDGEQCQTTDRGPLERSVEVRFQCSPNRLVPHFIDVFEDRICHYVMIIGTPALCNIPSFARWSRPVTSIICTDPVSAVESAASQPSSQPAVGEEDYAQSPSTLSDRHSKKGKRQIWLDRIGDLLDGGDGPLGAGGFPLLRRALWDLLESEFGPEIPGGLSDVLEPPRHALADLFAELRAAADAQDQSAASDRGQSPARRRGKVIIASVEDDDEAGKPSLDQSSRSDGKDRDGADGDGKREKPKMRKREFSFEF